jgi:hypothetical protein
VPIVYKFWEPQTPGDLMASEGLYRGYINDFDEIFWIRRISMAS